MPRYTRLCLALALCFVTAIAAPDKNKKEEKEKSPADLAADAFFKLREEKEAPPTPARQRAIIDAGFAYLQEYATHRRANTAIASLTTYASSAMKGKELAPQRAAWLTKLQFEIQNRNAGETKNVAAPAAMKALAASIAGQILKETLTKSNLLEYREKIDRLAEMPECSRFLSDQERAFIQTLKGIQNLPAAEKLATRLLTSTDKRVATMAQEELNLIILAKQPLELSFTTLDGKTVEAATLRGKPLFFTFWATTSEASIKDIETMKEVLSDFPKDKLSVILVCCDKAEDRPAAEKFVKSSRLKYPVWFTGTGLENEFAAKLNITKLPATVIFDAGGLLVSTSKMQGSLDQLRKILGIKKEN